MTPAKETRVVIAAEAEKRGLFRDPCGWGRVGWAIQFIDTFQYSEFETKAAIVNEIQERMR